MVQYDVEYYLWLFCTLILCEMLYSSGLMLFWLSRKIFSFMLFYNILDMVNWSIALSKNILSFIFAIGNFVKWSNLLLFLLLFLNIFNGITPCPINLYTYLVYLLYKKKCYYVTSYPSLLNIWYEENLMSTSCHANTCYYIYMLLILNFFIHFHIVSIYAFIICFYKLSLK